MSKVIITLPGDGLSVSKRQYAGAKSWIKLLTGVDTGKSDGYAFTGTWAKFEAAVEAEPGTFFLAYVEDRSASGRIRAKYVTLYRVTATEGLVTADHWKIPGPGAGWALHCRDDIAGHLADAASPDIAGLLAERARLLEQVTEIDAVLHQAGVAVPGDPDYVDARIEEPPPSAADLAGAEARWPAAEGTDD